MDQASLLREIMSNNKKSYKNTISFLNYVSENNDDYYNLLLKIINYSKKEYDEKRHSIVGIKINSNKFLEYVEDNLEQIKFSDLLIDNEIMTVDGELNFVDSVIKNKNKLKKIVKVFENVENQTDNLWMNIDNSINANNINLILRSNKLIIFTNGEEEEIEDIKLKISIIKKIDSEFKVGIIVNTFNQNHYERTISKFDYDKNIKGIGFFNNDYINIMEEEQNFYNLDLEFLYAKSDNKAVYEKLNQLF